MGVAALGEQTNTTIGTLCIGSQSMEEGLREEKEERERAAVVGCSFVRRNQHDDRYAT